MFLVKSCEFEPFPCRNIVDDLKQIMYIIIIGIFDIFDDSCHLYLLSRCPGDTSKICGAGGTNSVMKIGRLTRIRP